MAKKSKQRVWNKKKQRITSSKYLKERHEVKSAPNSAESDDPKQIFTPLERKCMQYVYVLRSVKDGKWHTGCTKELRKCFIEHNSGKVASTKGRGPLELIYFEACLDINDAYAREKYFKTGMGKRYLENRLKRFLSLAG